MTGYSMETRRRVSRSTRFHRVLERAWLQPAYRKTGRYLPMPDGVLKVPLGYRPARPSLPVVRLGRFLPARIDDRDRRHAQHRRKAQRAIEIEQLDMPTVYDYARMPPLARWKRTHTERLLQPAPGSNLVIRGEESLTWRQYVSAAAHKQLPELFRAHPQVDLYEYYPAARERYQMVPLGFQRATYQELLDLFVRSPWRNFPMRMGQHSGRPHRVSVSIWRDRYRWECLECGDSGYDHYGPEAIGRATGVLWYGDKHHPQLASLERRDFLKGGLAAVAGLAVWNGLVPFLAGPLGEAAATKFAAPDGNDANDGAFATPFKTLNYSATQLAGGDTLTLRGTGSGTFDSNADSIHTDFVLDTVPSGGSWAAATIFQGFAGETMRWKSATNRCLYLGSGKKFIIIDGTGSTFYVDAGSNLHAGFDLAPEAGPTSGVDHVRGKSLKFENTTGESNLWLTGRHCNTTRSTFIEAINCRFGGLLDSQFALYFSTVSDCLIEGCTFVPAPGSTGSVPNPDTGSGSDGKPDSGIQIWNNASSSGLCDAQTGMPTRNTVRSCVAGGFVGSTSGGVAANVGYGFSANGDNSLWYNLIAYNCNVGIRHFKGAFSQYFRITIDECLQTNPSISHGFLMDPTSETHDNSVRNVLSVNNGTDINVPAGTLLANTWTTANGDPHFVDKPNRDYRLRPHSACLGIGVDFASVQNGDP